MNPSPKPAEDNNYLAEHIAILRNSFRHWTGRELVKPGMSDVEAARFVFHAPFVVVSHDAAKDPMFNYANQTALDLFAMSWADFTALPSRLSAAEVDQEERARLLGEVDTRGYIENYRGIRIGRHGRRFLIEEAMVWNLLAPSGVHFGQAALFKHWTFL